MPDHNPHGKHQDSGRHSEQMIMNESKDVLCRFLWSQNLVNITWVISVRGEIDVVTHHI